MADGIKIEIVSPEQLLVSETAQSVTVPGADGYFTVVGEHSPLMTTLKPGFITVNLAKGPQVFFVRGGFADVAPDGLTILAELAEPIASFNPNTIDADIQKAENELAAASTIEERSAATEKLDAWRNLKLEAVQTAGVSTH
ncbi:MAG TPA: F0F1 ATP synthase subunit epsilon [Devosiaceae bacterium]|jgi:F-type H+-transporting ATPase subunit epsilon|nr:F0F1 ATP synthase subunit epsilon [Devosiaceae bacterium]